MAVARRSGLGRPGARSDSRAATNHALGAAGRPAVTCDGSVGRRRNPSGISSVGGWVPLPPRGRGARTIYYEARRATCVADCIC